ncbi:MAG: hypothetical protein Q4C56_04660 [Peptococcaceae bacterium]|nr:hypothetical protein [Peptococcaceae bacterium]
MKKILLGILAVLLVIGMISCGSANPDKSVDDRSNTSVKETEMETTETETVTLDGIAVDDSYVDDEEDASSLKRVYLFLTLHPENENLSVSSVGVEMTIDDNNTYSTEHHFNDDVCKLAHSYYYSSYLEDVYMGDTKKLLVVFEVPEADLEKGRSLSFYDSSVPTMDELSISTDDIQHFETAEALVQAMDPDGYAVEQDARTDADAETTALVKSLINGYQWSFYINTVSYELEFWEDNNFELRATIGSSSPEPNQGTYAVKKGYIFCTYPSNNYTVEIPYTLEDGDIDLDVTTAFDVKE